MQKILRSMLSVNAKDNPEDLLKNYSVFLGTQQGFDQQKDTTIWNFIREFIQKHRHVPEYTTVRNYFEHSGDVAIVDRVEYLSTLKPLRIGDFTQHLEQLAEDRRIRRTTEVLSEALNINTTGMTLKGPRGQEKLLKGPHDALHYINEKSRNIVAPVLSGKLSGSVTEDGDEVLTEYEKVKADPLAGRGQKCGLEPIDDALGGAKRGELWTHAAFTGGLKSTFMLNWIYNLCVNGESSLVFSLEMPYTQVRRILFVMHSLHPKVQQRFKEQTGKKMPEVSYKKVRDGTLNEAEEAAFAWVVEDFGNPENGYGQIHIEVANPDKTDFTVSDLRSKAELIYSKNPFSVLVVDHMGLMAPRKWVSSTTERQNEVIRDLKKLAMGFNRGSGIAVIGLYQINRTGYQEALKNGGNYNLTHLSYANECERSSDIVTASWVDDDLRKLSQARFMCLKSRDDSPFPPFFVHIEWNQRRMATLQDPNLEIIEARGDELDEIEDLDKELDLLFG